MIEALLPYKLQIIETVIVLIALFIIRFISRKEASKVFHRLHIDIQRKKITHRIINIFITIATVVVLAAIWNIDQTQLMLFITSILTVLGIAFFAQWSILSNITASLILFFNHPLRIGDTIQVLDKEYSIEGTLEDISFFFVHIRTPENETITIPNNLALQKMIKTIKNKNTTEK
jgi:small-conductance mechanosensitive channel